MTRRGRFLALVSGLLMTATALATPGLPVDVN